jgi:hypothetical protein
LNGTTNTHFGYIFGASTYVYHSLFIPPSLKTVIITGGSSIGDYAFNACNGLTSITIPDSVASISNNAFESCNGLTAINVAPNNPNYVSQDGILYNKAKTTIIFVLLSISGSITIPDSVTSIGFRAFLERTGLINVTIGNSVTSIDFQAFIGCTGLTSITIPSSVTSIGSSAFAACSGLTSVTFETGSNIISTNFVNGAFPEGTNGDGGDELQAKYITGGAGTYTREANGNVWTKQVINSE